MSTIPIMPHSLGQVSSLFLFTIFETFILFSGGWVHPVEDMVVICCQLFFPLVISPVHPFSFWCFTFFWTLCLIEEHSGIMFLKSLYSSVFDWIFSSGHDVWWAPYNWMPFAKKPIGGGGAPHGMNIGR
jgi:cholesterol 25-hydroxylase